MAWAISLYSPPSHRLSGSAWPTRPSVCSRGYTRSSSRVPTRIRGPTTKVHQHPPTYHILTQPNRTGFAVITWVSIYWFSRAGPAASIRIYYELARAGETIKFPKTTVPVGLSFFPKEPIQLPKACVPTPFFSGHSSTDDGRGYGRQFVAF
jgi:hypothetical protein